MRLSIILEGWAECRGRQSLPLNYLQAQGYQYPLQDLEQLSNRFSSQSNYMQTRAGIATKSPGLLSSMAMCRGGVSRIKAQAGRCALLEIEATLLDRSLYMQTWRCAYTLARLTELPTHSIHIQQPPPPSL